MLCTHVDFNVILAIMSENTGNKSIPDDANVAGARGDSDNMESQDASKKPKTAAQLKKEAQKREKLEKFKAKKEKEEAQKAAAKDTAAEVGIRCSLKSNEM